MSVQPTFKILPGEINHGNSIEVGFQVNAERYKIFFRSADIPLTANLEAFLAAILLPCMASGGGTIAAPGEISQRLLSAIPTIQDILQTWEPSYRRAEIGEAAPVTRSASTDGRVGAFFSLGVDSFYTLMKHGDEITDLILIHGFDIPLTDTTLRENISTHLRQVAAHFGKNVIEIETNVRELIDPYISFGHLGYGIGLFIVGHLLAPALQRIYVPSSFSYAHILPHGSHPLLDPLWSAESLEFVHDGCERTRLQKVEQIANEDIILKHLRVCYGNLGGAYNCGICEKCIRTMLSLLAFDSLDRCPAFATPLTAKNIRRLQPIGESINYTLPENLKALKKKGGNKDLVNALQAVLNRPLWLRKFLRRVGGYKRKLMRRSGSRLA